MVVIEDDEILKLMLPKQWGIDDVPVIVRDKEFNADRQIDYQLDVMTAAVGWFGDTLLTNGAIYPQRCRVVGCACVCSMAVMPAQLNFRHQRQSPAVCDCQRRWSPEPVKVSELPVLMGNVLKMLVEVNDNKPLTW